MKRFKKILLVTEPIAEARFALNRAVDLAIKNNAELTVVAVSDAKPSDSPTKSKLDESLAAEKLDLLEDLVNDTYKGVELTINCKVFTGQVFLEVIREVLRNGHDLVIKPAEKPKGIKPFLFGSTDFKIMRKCPCPVWIMKEAGRENYKNVLAAVDARNPILNRQILELATSISQQESAQLHVVRVWDLHGEGFFRSGRSGLSDDEVDAMVSEEQAVHSSWLEKLTKRHCSDSAAPPQTHLIKGDAKFEVAYLARELDVDVIVMGTVGRSGVSGFLMGNTAEQILNQVDCSALVIKPPEFVSPVLISDQS